MKKYHVVFFYLASGMEGNPAKADLGFIEANSEDEAKEIASIKKIPVDRMYGPNNEWSSRDFYKTCLMASESGYKWTENRWVENGEKK